MSRPAGSSEAGPSRLQTVLGFVVAAGVCAGLWVFVNVLRGDSLRVSWVGGVVFGLLLAAITVGYSAWKRRQHPGAGAEDPE